MCYPETKHGWQPTVRYKYRPLTFLKRAKCHQCKLMYINIPDAFESRLCPILFTVRAQSKELVLRIKSAYTAERLVNQHGFTIRHHHGGGKDGSSQQYISFGTSTSASSSSSSQPSTPDPQSSSPLWSDASGSSKDPLLAGRSSVDSFPPMLLSYDAIPEWYQDNDCIRHGYCPESRSVRKCFASWFYLHNENVNIFSHLIRAVVFLSAEIWIWGYFQADYSHARPLERFVFAFFLLTAFVCLGLSATYHALMNHSAKISHLWLRFDFVGIAVSTLGVIVSGIYMAFYCEPTLQKVYWAMVRETRIVCDIVGLALIKTCSGRS